MTDRIDLDDVDASTDEQEEENHGDWFWRDEGSPEEDPGPADRDADLGAADDAAPRVPGEHDDSPVGVPIEGGGAGAGGSESPDTGSGAMPGVPDSGGNPADGSQAGSASHGDAASEPSDMTQAFTYRALKSLADVPAVLAEAETWADWLGIVGHVDAHVINKFQREHRIDLDFFNGSGTGPAERLAAIGERSMFYADRMVLVGIEGEAEIAEEAGWEFVPLDEAAEKAGWELD